MNTSVAHLRFNAKDWDFTFNAKIKERDNATATLSTIKVTQEEVGNAAGGGARLRNCTNDLPVRIKSCHFAAACRYQTPGSLRGKRQRSECSHEHKMLKRRALKHNFCIRTNICSSALTSGFYASKLLRSLLQTAAIPATVAQSGADRNFPGSFWLGMKRAATMKLLFRRKLTVWTKSRVLAPFPAKRRHKAEQMFQTHK